MEVELVKGAVQESLSGIMSEVRASARSRGIITATILHPHSIADIQQRTYSRLQGLVPLEERDTVPLPTLDDIRTHLTSLGVRAVGDSVELRVIVPPPREAHAR